MWCRVFCLLPRLTSRDVNTHIHFFSLQGHTVTQGHRRSTAAQQHTPQPPRGAHEDESGAPRPTSRRMPAHTHLRAATSMLLTAFRFRAQPLQRLRSEVATRDAPILSHTHAPCRVHSPSHALPCAQAVVFSRRSNSEPFACLPAQNGMLPYSRGARRAQPSMLLVAISRTSFETPGAARMRSSCAFIRTCRAASCFFHALNAPQRRAATCGLRLSRSMTWSATKR